MRARALASLCVLFNSIQFNLWQNGVQFQNIPRNGERKRERERWLWCFSNRNGLSWRRRKLDGGHVCEIIKCEAARFFFLLSSSSWWKINRRCSPEENWRLHHRNESISCIETQNPPRPAQPFHIPFQQLSPGIVIRQASPPMKFPFIRTGWKRGRASAPLTHGWATFENGASSSIGWFARARYSVLPQAMVRYSELWRSDDAVSNWSHVCSCYRALHVAIAAIIVFFLLYFCFSSRCRWFVVASLFVNFGPNQESLFLCVLAFGLSTVAVSLKLNWNTRITLRQAHRWLIRHQRRPDNVDDGWSGSRTHSFFYILFRIVSYVFNCTVCQR